jgi:hypothetical protein
VVDRCPSCETLQKRWVIPSYKKEEIVVCTECYTNFFDNSNIYQIIMMDNVSFSSKSASF